jgi:demethylmenaquinone methyltransferase/2-methoxy-6-polyprenyl-1,4-benzoquinol methylase
MYRFYLTKVLPGVGKWISRNREGAYHYFSKSVLQFEKGESLADKLRQAGLQEVSFQQMTCGVVSLYRGRKQKTAEISS